MKKVMFPFIFLLSFSLFVCSQNVEKAALVEESGTGFFLTDKGHVITSYHLVAEASEIGIVVQGKNVSYELLSKDPVNNIAVLKPKDSLNVKPLKLFLGEVEKEEPVVNISFSKNQKGTQLIHNGKVMELTGIQNDIRHMQIEFLNQAAPLEGPVFNKFGLCIGIVSRQETDIYSLLQEEGASNPNMIFAKKIEYLFPLVKNMKGVVWSENQDGIVSEETPLFLNDSVVSVNVKCHAADEPSSDDAGFASIRDKVPEGVLFIYVSIASGYDNPEFANNLLEELRKQKIGQPISLQLKQQYYSSIVKKFGHSQMNAEELVKVAADLANGYYLKANCSIVANEVEDCVELLLYKPHSTQVLAGVSLKKVINTSPEEAIKELTVSAVKQLAKDLKSKKIPLFFKE